MTQFIDIAAPSPRERDYPPFEGTCTRAIALIGVSGAGKSAVGAYLGGVLSVPFVDADVLCEERLGIPVHTAVISSPEIYEATQAEVTAGLLADLTDAPDEPRIVALAPSPSMTQTALEGLREAGEAGCLIVELVADVSEVSRRMGLNAPRSVALGAPRAMLAKMIQATREQHAHVANVSVNTVGRTIADIGQEILASL